MMGTAVVVGSIGVYALVWAGMASLHVRPLLFGGVLSGAILFGIGMATLGYCPGTSIAGCGEGRRDAMFGVLGMFGGAALFVALFPLLKPLIKGLGDWGEITLPEATHTSPWLWIALLMGAGGGAFFVGSSYDQGGDSADRQRKNTEPQCQRIRYGSSRLEFEYSVGTFSLDVVDTGSS